MDNTVKHNLDTYKILYLIKGILTLVFSLFFMVYIGMGVFIGAAIEADPTEDLPFNPGIIFSIIGTIGMFICIVIGVLTLLASKYIKERRNYRFIFAIAIINCLTGILGILLGVFTLIEISKPEIKALFYGDNEN